MLKMPSNRVRWKPRAVRTKTPVEDDQRVVQEFIYTGRWPVSHRVTTLFGRAVLCLRIEADRERPPLPGRYEFGGGQNIVSNSKGCTIVLDEDPEITAFAEAAHLAAFPDVPLLGVDVLREVPGGRCYVLEVNPGGWTWHFSTRSGLRLREELGLDTYGQMGGLERAAEILAEQALVAAR